MPGPGNNKSHLRESAINRSAALEQLIFQIEWAHRNAASYHNSELAARSIGNAHASLAEAIRSLSLGHHDRVDRLLNVTWFYAKFAQDIIAAEATEHLLGNDRFIDLIEQIGHLGKKSPLEQAENSLKRLATAIAEMPEVVDFQAGNYIGLYVDRVEKAKRTYAKAIKALGSDNAELAIEHAERGLLHLQLADIHGRHSPSSNLSLIANEVGKPKSEAGGCEEIITLLADCICKIKLLAEYKNIQLSSVLKERLTLIVQSLQDAIENYARADHTTAFDTAINGLVWSQYVYGRLSSDVLLPVQDQAKTLRGLYKLALEAGLASFEPICLATSDGLEKIERLEGFLQLALGAYIDGDINELDKYVRLGSIEAGALSKYAEKAKNQALVNELKPEATVRASTRSPRR